MSRFHAIAACLVSLALQPSPDQPKIAYAAHVNGNWEIFVMSEDGSARKQLTMQRTQERFPLWSPDRKQIAYGIQIGADWGWELWLMDADGSNAKRLVSKIVAKGTRGWSPDGKHILLAATVDNDIEIITVRAADGAITRLTNSKGEDRDPCWSPDGQSIAFASQRDGDFDIYVMRADGSALRRLTSNTVQDGGPAWSPDGARVAFVSGREGVRDIHVASVADGKTERLTNSGRVTNDVAKWSPNGSQLAVQVAHDKNYDIEVISLNGSSTRVAASPEFDGQYTWSPDGNRIAYVSERKDGPGVYVTDVRKGATRRIVAGSTLNPAWGY